MASRGNLQINMESEAQLGNGMTHIHKILILRWRAHKIQKN